MFGFKLGSTIMTILLISKTRSNNYDNLLCFKTRSTSVTIFSVSKTRSTSMTISFVNKICFPTITTIDFVNKTCFCQSFRSILSSVLDFFSRWQSFGDKYTILDRLCTRCICVYLQIRSEVEYAMRISKSIGPLCFASQI